MSRLSQEELDAVLTSIRMRINFIETGDVVFSATDAAEYNKSVGPKEKQVTIRALGADQLATLTILRAAQRRLSAQHLRE